jgi:CRP-like cAMP-binding protein
MIDTDQFARDGGRPYESFDSGGGSNESIDHSVDIIRHDHERSSKESIETGRSLASGCVSLYADDLVEVDAGVRNDVALRNNARKFVRAQADFSELASASIREHNPWSFTMELCAEDIRKYLEHWTPQQKRRCIWLLKRWQEHSRKRIRQRTEHAWHKLVAVHHTDPKYVASRYRDAAALAVLRFEPPGTRSEAHVTIVTDWLVKNRVMASINTLHSDTLRELAQWMQIRDLQRNHLLFCQGEPGVEFYVLYRGTVDLFTQFSTRAEQFALYCETHEYKNENPIDATHRNYLNGHLGELVLTLKKKRTEFGEMSLLTKAKRNTSAVVSSNSTLIVVPGPIYKRTLAKLHTHKLALGHCMDFLRTTDICAGWRDALLSQLAYVLTKKHYRRNTRLVSAGDKIEIIRIIIDGEVGVISGCYNVASNKQRCFRPGSLENREYIRLGPKCLLGDLEVAEGQEVHSMSYVTSTTTSCYEMAVKDYNRFLGERIKLNRRHNDILGARKLWHRELVAIEAEKRRVTTDFECVVDEIPRHRSCVMVRDTSQQKPPRERPRSAPMIKTPVAFDDTSIAISELSHVPMYKLRPTFKMSGSSAKRQMMERQLRLNEAVTQDSAERLRDRQKISREGMAPPRPSTASPYFMKGNKTRVFPRAAPGKALSSTVHIASPATVSWPKARLISHSQIGRSSDRQTLKLKIN